MGRRRKTAEQYEQEATRVGSCLVHSAKTGNLARKLYQLRHGVIGDPKVLVCHTCDRPACIKDEHHFLGSQLDNMQDMKRKGRSPDRRGSKHPMFGRQRPDTSERNRRNSPAKGHVQTPQHKAKIAAALAAAWARRKNQ